MPFAAFLVAADAEERHDRHRVRLSGDGTSGHRAERLRRLLLQAQARRRERTAAGTCREERRWPSASTSASSAPGFGGSISAFRLAELYQAAGQSPEHPGARARRRVTSTPTSASRWTSSTCSRASTAWSRAQGAQIVVGDGVGGGSNLYLAASLRSPTRDLRAPRPPARRRPRPAHVAEPRSAARRSNPYYARAEQALRVQRPDLEPGAEVRRPVGRDAQSPPGTPATACRVAIDLNRCIQARWCHTGCIFAREELGDHQLPGLRRANGRRGPPELRGGARAPEPSRPYRYVVTASRSTTTAPTRRASRPAQTFEIECKVLILAAGAMGNPPLLMRSRPALPSLSSSVGQHLGINGDHIAAIEYDEQKVRDVLGLPGYGQIYKGNHIATMSYDWFAGRSDHSVRRHALHAAGDLPVVAGARPVRRRARSRPATAVLVGAAEEAGALDVQQPHRDAGDGRGHARRRSSSRRRPPAATSGRTPARSAWARSSTSCPTSRSRSARPPNEAIARRGRAQRARPAHEAHLSAPPTPHIRSAAAGWRTRATWAWSTTAARCSATRASSAWTRRRSRPRWR